MLGIVFFPVICCWFLLRRGYSDHLRIVAFLWAAIALVIGLVSIANP